MEAPRAMTSAVQHLEQLVKQVRATGHFDQSKRYPSVSFTLGPNEFLIDHAGFLLQRHLVNTLATVFKLDISMVRRHTERFEFGNTQTKSGSITCDRLGCRSSTGLREPCSVNYVVRYHLALPYDPSWGPTQGSKLPCQQMREPARLREAKRPSGCVDLQ